MTLLIIIKISAIAMLTGLIFLRELLDLVESKEGIAEQEWTSWEVSRFPTNNKINHRQQGAGLQRSKEFGKQQSHF